MPEVLRHVFFIGCLCHPQSLSYLRTGYEMCMPCPTLPTFLSAMSCPTLSTTMATHHIMTKCIACLAPGTGNLQMSCPPAMPTYQGPVIPVVKTNRPFWLGSGLRSL